MKRVVSGLAALGIALSGMALGASSAYAATSTEAYKDYKGEITIKNPNDDDTAHTLNGYQLGWLYEVTSDANGKLKSFQIDTNDSYVETIEAALEDVKSTKDTSKSLYDLYADSPYYNDKKGGAAAPQDEANPLGWIAENIQGNQLAYRNGWSGQGSTELRLFANALKAEFEKTGAPEKTSNLKTGNNTVGEGYYLLLDQFNGASADAGEAASDKTAKPTQSIPILVTSTIPVDATTDKAAAVTEELGEVTLKSSATSITKQVVDKDGNAVTEPDYNIGDDIYYELTTTIPDYTSYAKCDTYSADNTDCRKLTVTDTADEGLTIQDVESVKVGETSIAKESDYDVTIESLSQAESGERKTTIDLGKYVNSTAVDANYVKTVTIRIKAYLNEDAKISTPGNLNANVNKVSLTYSNKFDKVGDTKTIDGGEVNVYTFKLKLKKTAMDGTTSLKDAKFKVQKDNGNWLTPVQDSESHAITAWKEVTDEKNAYEFTSDTNGEISELYGLEAGTYTVKETEPAPDYTTFGLPTFKVTITAKYGADTSSMPTDHTGDWGDYMLNAETITLSGNDSRVYKDGVEATSYTIHVKNAKNLAELPMTGGAGLMAIIAVGVLLAGAGAAAAVRSRKSASRAVRV